MAKIKNIKELRDFALDALEKLSNREIDVSEAAVTGKLCGEVLGTLKSQYEYARLINDENPQIEFMQVSPHSSSNKNLLEEFPKGKQLGRTITYQDE